MKKIINGRKYDTETADYLGEYSYGCSSDFEYIIEKLYIKNTGEYFLFGEGGPKSKYAQVEAPNTVSGGSRIIPITEDRAKRWAEKHLTCDEYEAIFGEVEE